MSGFDVGYTMRWEIKCRRSNGCKQGRPVVFDGSNGRNAEALTNERFSMILLTIAAGYELVSPAAILT